MKLRDLGTDGVAVNAAFILAMHALGEQDRLLMDDETGMLVVEFVRAAPAPKTP